MSFARFILDPSILFGLSVFLCPVMLSGDWMRPEAMFKYLTDPVSLIGFGMLAIVMISTAKSSHGKRVLSSTDNLVANWFLMNGIVIHLMMDGLVGSFSRFKFLLPPMTAHYNVLDARFALGEPHALTVTLCELCIMCPLALLSYRARVLGRPYSPVIEAVTSAFQLFGTIVFVMPEVVLAHLDVQTKYTLVTFIFLVFFCLRGHARAQNAPCEAAEKNFPHVPVDRDLTFSGHHILYFWFAFVAANPVWIIVPLIVIVSACKNVSKALAAVKPKRA